MEIVNKIKNETVKWFTSSSPELGGKREKQEQK